MTIETHEWHNFVSKSNIKSQNKPTKMKKLILAATLFTAVSFIACNSANTDSVTAAKDSNAVKIDSNVINDSVKRDVKFTVTAANGGMTEVQVSKLALTKSTNPDVTMFAQMMVKDHSKANDELKALAATKNITLPIAISDDNQKKIDKLSAETEKNFDKDYSDMMVDDHNSTVDLFKSEANNGNDSAIKAWATATIPTLEHHLEMADSLKARVHK
jgi:putative membrane protein